MNYLSLLCCLGALTGHSQQLYPPVVIDGSQPWTSGTIRLDNVETFIYQNSSRVDSDVELKAAAEIVLSPNAVAGEYSSTGQFHAVIEPQALSVVSFHPNGWYDIPRYDKFEMGVKLPVSVQSQIDAFLNGQPGLNPYDPDQVKVECNFNNGAYFRYGFYYRDYTVENNAWIEKPTAYTYRIRIAPEQIVSNKAVINLYVNGVLTETVTRYFGVQNSSNLGHLEMADGNLLKMQYNNGQIFFGIGQNIPYAIPDNVNGNCHAGDCNSPHTFQKQRDYLADLAANGGNFTRVRMDALNMLVEWPYKQELNTDPIPANKPLSAYLNNYNGNQRYLWEFDRIFSTLENNNIKAILCLLPDQNFSVDNDSYDPYHQYTWDHNPYSTITGTSLAGCKAFFTNQQSVNTYRKWLYYVQARYGYSTSLAMWQMINETANAANATGQKHALDIDPAFGSDLRTWVCDMAYYMQQSYPLRPVTTGFVSPVNLKNFAYNCLNVWSSNSYVGYVSKDTHEYQDSDYDRTKTSIGPGDGYFPNYKPFFWGELGIGDSANVMDRKSDRCFHNAVWASAFSGGISNGLYWNDWEQQYGVNHRKNFQSLKAFTDMIDFSQRLEPGQSKDQGALGTQYHIREIHTWWLKNGAKNFAVGWTKNNSANVFQDLGNLTQQERDQVVLSTRIYEYTLADYTCFSTNLNPSTVIEDLIPLTNYRIKIYNTYNNANEIEVKNEMTSASGKLSFRRTMPSYIDDPFNPDYAFIIKPSSTWRMSGSNEISALDTLFVTTDDTIHLHSRFTNKNKVYDYSWSGSLADLNSKTESVKVSYPKEGNFIVDLEAKSHEADTSIHHRFYIIVTNSDAFTDLNKTSIYPNPANNFVYLYYNEESVKNPIINCTDVFGKEYEFAKIGKFKFDTSKLPDGIFLIKFRYGNNERVFKISIIH